LLRLSSGLSFLALSLLCQYAYCAEQTTDDRQRIISRPIEEIRVIGEMTSSALRIQIRNLEAGIYDTLNAAIDNEDFKMLCSYPRRVSSFIRRRVCELGLLARLRREAYAEASAMTGNPSDPETARIAADLLNNGGAMDLEIKKGIEEYKLMVDAIASDNPQLTADIFQRYDLTQELNQRKENYWSNLFG